MFVTVDGIKIFYERHEGEDIPILLLHGWGGSNISFKGLFNCLKENNKSVINIDFPLFGQSDAPPNNWGIYEYAEFINNFMITLQIPRYTVIGHSFGGRVGILLAAYGYTEKLALVDAAGLKPHRGLKYRLRVLSYKRAKRLGKPLSKYGSSDFKSLPDGAKDIFVRVVNQHLDGYLKKIECETLIVWGKDDKDTPLKMAKKLEKRIKQSSLILLNGGHYAYAENYFLFNNIILSFV